jgi:hypothetical protein
MIFLTGMTLTGRAQIPEKPDVPGGILDPFEQEILRLNEQTSALEAKMNEERDGKQKHRMAQAILLTQDVINWMKKERIETRPKRKAKMNRLLEENREALEILLQEISEVNKQHTTPRPAAPTPTPLPEIFETENGFKIRLRMPD